MKKALVIDGNSMFYRMYYATAKQVDWAIQNNWVPNNAIKLMLNQIVKFIVSNNYEYYFVAFDAGKKTFRHDELETYKNNRQKTPDELIKQMQDCITAINYLGIKTLAKDAIEADDLVGSFVKKMNEQNVFVDVFSSDKDMLQLVAPLCDVSLMKTGMSVIDKFTVENFASKFYNLSPCQIIEYKSIIGDSSDSLLGISGIGPKTGVDLLNKYGTLDNIYENIHELSVKIQEKFIRDRQQALQCRMLATILTNELQEFTIDDFLLGQIQHSEITEIVEKYKLWDVNNYIISKQGS